MVHVQMDQCQKDWERERREMIALFQVYCSFLIYRTLLLEQNTEKKKILIIYKKIQKGSVAKS